MSAGGLGADRRKRMAELIKYSGTSETLLSNEGD
jgi:hypothetical protein